VQRFSGNNFPVTFKRGLRSAEEKQRNAKQIEANEKERDGSGLAGDAGDCAETWLQSTNPRETTPPPTAYSSPSLLSLFSLFLPPPPLHVLFGGTSNACDFFSPHFPAIITATAP